MTKTLPFVSAKAGTVRLSFRFLFILGTSVVTHRRLCSLSQCLAGARLTELFLGLLDEIHVELLVYLIYRNGDSVHHSDIPSTCDTAVSNDLKSRLLLLIVIGEHSVGALPNKYTYCDRQRQFIYSLTCTVI